MYTNILAVLQGKSSDELVIHHALELAHTSRGTVTLLRVITIMADGPRGLGKQFQTELGSSGWRNKQNAERDLSRIQGSLLARGLSTDTAIVVGTGGQADEIVDFAEQGGCDLIVMASDGHSWFRRVLTDCPIDGVHRLACIPVLCVNAGERRRRMTSKVEDHQGSLMALLGEAGI